MGGPDGKIFGSRAEIFSRTARPNSCSQQLLHNVTSLKLFIVNSDTVILKQGLDFQSIIAFTLFAIIVQFA